VFKSQMTYTKQGCR